MKTIAIITGFLLLSLPFFSMAQVAPQAEPVYGAHVEKIDNIPLSSTSTRVFASVSSPNSIFYTDITNTGTSSASFTTWTVVPDLDLTGNYGRLRDFAVDENSGFIFAMTENNQFIGASTTAGSVYVIGNYMVEAIEAYDSRLFWIRHQGSDEYMFSADISLTGTLSNFDSSLIVASSGWNPPSILEIHINPVNKKLYVFVPGYPPLFYKSSSTYLTHSNTTTWTLLSSSSLWILNRDFQSMGIAPDGRLFAASYDGNSSGYTSKIAYTTTDSDPWTVTTLGSGQDMGRGKISISDADASGNYYIYNSRVYSANKGITWNSHGGADGAIIVDPNNMKYAYVRTDWGMGIFNDYTPAVTEINDGLLAVQVDDFAMNATKDTAWVASKSGVWHVSDYGGTTPTWSAPIWPQNHTEPWRQVECGTYANLLYCGNNSGNVFRWKSSSGSYTNTSNYQEIFQAHSSSYPYYTWTYGVYNSAIAIDHNYTNERIFIGLYDEEDWNEPQSLGGVFVGEPNSMGIWTFTQIMSGTMISDGCDVNDIVCTEEMGHVVLYVGVERNTSFSGTVNGIYRIEETTPGNWTATNDLATSAYPIAATITDLWISDNDTIYACGTDASWTTNLAFKKAIGDTYWISLHSSGLPSAGVARSITCDATTNDVYVAIENEIYGIQCGYSVWSKIWTYPLGTSINFIYYDDLLVGTSTGLFAHWSNVGLMENEKDGIENPVKVGPNPFEDRVTFSFDLPKGQKIILKIFDASGKEIRTVVEAYLTQKSYKLMWNGNNDAGNPVAKGSYIYQLQVGSKTYSGKITK